MINKIIKLFQGSVKSKLWSKCLILTVITLSVFMLTACNKNETTQEEEVYLPEVKMIKVKTGLEQEFTVTGEVFAHKKSTLTAEYKSKVESISVKEGDSVAKNKVLISLSSSTINSSLNSASKTLNNAESTLNNTQLSAESSIQAAQITLNTALVNLENVLSQNKASARQAEEALKAAQITLDLGVSSAQTSLDNTINTTYTTVQTAFDAANKILGIVNFYKYAESTDVNFRKYLGAAKSNSKKEAEDALQYVYDLMANYVKSYDSALNLLSAMEEALQKLLTALNYSIANTYYTKTQIATDITSVNTQISYIKSATNSLKTYKAALETAQQQDGSGKSQTELSAEAAYNSTMATLKTNEESARRSVESAKNALESAKKSAELSKISAKTSVDSAYGSYDQARINKNKLTITAPFAGKVSDINVKAGEEVGAGTQLITIKDDSKLKLVAYLSSDDVTKIKVGDKITINKNGESGSIASISPSADPITKKYKVEISHTSTQLKPGELVQITFKSSEKKSNTNSIYIPLSALHILPGDIFVWKVRDQKTVKAQVTTGSIFGNYIEILSGLNAGDEIVSTGGRLIENEGTKVKIFDGITAPQIPKK